MVYFKTKNGITTISRSSFFPYNLNTLIQGSFLADIKHTGIRGILIRFRLSILSLNCCKLPFGQDDELKYSFHLSVLNILIFKKASSLQNIMRYFYYSVSTLDSFSSCFAVPSIWNVLALFSPIHWRHNLFSSLDIKSPSFGNTCCNWLTLIFTLSSLLSSMFLAMFTVCVCVFLVVMPFSVLWHQYKSTLTEWVSLPTV